MNRFESKYFNTAILMNEALISLLDKKDFKYITIKDICLKAGVNRSTFYLHYQTIDDLLNECSTYITNKFYNYLNTYISDKNITSKIDFASIENLYFMTPEYLVPYLTFIKENKKLYSTMMNYSTTLKLDKSYNKMFKEIFNPILERFNVDEYKREYILSFFLSGINSIVRIWLNNDCKEDINKIIEIINTCIRYSAKDKD